MIDEQRYDFDEFDRRKALFILSRLDVVFKIRYSSNGKLHVSHNSEYKDPILSIYDENRRTYGSRLGFCLLFDVKFGKKSGCWVVIRNLIDLMNFLY